MKNKLLNKRTMLITAFTLFVCLISGCKKSLDLEPLDRITDIKYWNKPEEFKLAVNTFYDYLRSFSNGNGDGHTGTDLGADRGAFARGTNTVVSNDDNYNNAYKWIREINYMLEKADAFDAKEDIKRYVAEAKFFRAYVYFDKLLTSYGGVILVKETLDTDAEQLKGTRSSREETIDFITEDLEAAIANLPTENEISSEDKGRVSKEAAQAFLGRVCLYEGTWLKFRGLEAARATTLLDKSIQNSNAVINSSAFTLFKPAVLGDSALKYLFILENQKSNPAGITKGENREYILAVRYESNNLLKTIPNQISFGALGADMSRKMADMYLSLDGLPINKTKLSFSRKKLNSEFENRDNRMRYFMAIPGRRYWQNATNWRVDWIGGPADIANARPPHDTWGNGISGYENQQWAAERKVPNSQEGYDYPVIRLAEVYLNYAEAVYERNGNIADADLDKSINLVRNRVNAAMPKLSNTLVSTNALDMREEIRRERAVELQGENFRMDDLKRWYIAHTELNKPVLGVRYTDTEYATKYPNLGVPLNSEGDVIADTENERRFTEKNYLIPIPTNQIQLNPNLEQNPGW
jgi:starch-binding outer membrane protein, SusD/RagB family